MPFTDFISLHNPSFRLDVLFLSIIFHGSFSNADPVKIIKVNCIIIHIVLIFLFLLTVPVYPFDCDPVPECLLNAIGAEMSLATFFKKLVQAPVQYFIHSLSQEEIAQELHLSGS